MPGKLYHCSYKFVSCLLLFGLIAACSYSGIQRGTAKGAGHIPFLDTERINRTNKRLLISPETSIELATDVPEVLLNHIDIRAHAVRGVTQVFPFASVQSEAQNLRGALAQAYANRVEMLMYFSPRFRSESEATSGWDLRLITGLWPAQSAQHIDIRLFDVLSGQELDTGAIVISRSFWKVSKNAEQIDVAFRQYAAMVSGRD